MTPSALALARARPLCPRPAPRRPWALAPRAKPRLSQARSRRRRGLTLHKNRRRAIPASESRRPLGAGRREGKSLSIDRPRLSDLSLGSTDQDDSRSRAPSYASQARARAGARLHTPSRPRATCIRDAERESRELDLGAAPRSPCAAISRASICVRPPR